jgi:tetratricopeptide (TPR) repeat protein
MKIFASAFFLLIFNSVLFAQDYQSDKHYKKMLDAYKKSDYNKAIEEMRFVLDKYEDVDKVWEIAIQLHYERYLKTPKTEDAMTQQLIDALANINEKKGKSNNITMTVSSPREIYYDNFISICRESSLKSRDPHASMYLRIIFIDETVNDSIPPNALKYFREAEDNFQKKDFYKALESYEKAIVEFPEFYKAILYKGDSYYHLADYKNAALYYSKAAALAPGLLEPVKYLTDAYGRDKLYDEAMAACIKGITIYPDVSMFMKLEDITDAQGKKSIDPWMKRPCYPVKSFRTFTPTMDNDWKVYQQAKSKIQPFCDSTGAIITKNDLTSQLFMETYCWEEMLNTTTDSKFDFAKKMQKEGYLDCYVFITMYHIDIHKQYRQFALNNDQRIKTYVTKYLISQ